MVGYVSADPDTSLIRETQLGYERVEIPAEAMTVRVDGDSMSPVAWSGQHLLIDPQRFLKNGDLAVVKTKAGKVYFKRYFLDKKRKLITLMSVNPTGPLEPIHLEEKDLASAYKVVGVLFE